MNVALKKTEEEKVYASESQLRYLREALSHQEGKLPLFDENGEEISKVTINS